MQAYIIAEIGANHQGELRIAKHMISELVGTGVSAVKTCKQSMKEAWKNIPYSGPHSFGKTYFDHRKELELSDRDFIELAAYARSKGFDFISSFTDIESLEFLKTMVKPEYYKICSSRTVDDELLRECVGLKLIMSTGMTTWEIIEYWFYILKPYYLLICTSSYPTERKDINLRNIYRYLNMLSWCRVGISGHHIGIEPDLYAYAMGASVIERHYTFDKQAKGSDHHLSLTANEFKELSNRIADLEIMLGSVEKKVLECEKPAIKKLRRDLEFSMRM